MAFYFSFIIASGYILVTFSRHLKIRALESPPRRSSFARALLLLQFLAFVAAGAHLYFAFKHVGVGATLTEVRGALATQSIEVPVAIRLLGQLRYVNYFAPLALYAMYKTNGARLRTVVLSFVFACVYPICYLERSGIMRMFMLIVFAYLYFSVNSLRKVFTLSAVSLGVLIPLVVVVPILRGQAESANAYVYIAGAWSGFDNFVSGSGTHPVVVLEDQDIYVKSGGYEAGDAPPLSLTMTELYRACNAITACNVRLSNFFEYVYTPVYTNIYTLARTFYQDFGPWGAPVATAAFAAFLAFLYMFCISGGGVFHLYVAAYIAYVCAMSVLSDNFLMRDIVFTGIFAYALAWCFGGRTFWFGRKAVSAGSQMASGSAQQ